MRQSGLTVAKAILLGTTVLSAYGGMAHAQAAPATPPAEPESAATVDDIVVTAQRREERLQDVPIAMTAVSAEDLTRAGVTTATDLNLLAPGLNYASNGAFAQPTIRGIGTSFSGAGADANVAIYLDGVYQPSQIANFFDFNNIVRVEVLKGPQGTLFGRNATGGAINITTKTPSSTPSADLSVGFASFNRVNATAYMTRGFGDQVAADLALLYQDDDGYADNLLTGNTLGALHSFGARSKIKWTPSDALSLTLAGFYSEREDNSPFVVEPINRNNYQVPTHPTLVFPADPYKVSLDTDPAIETTSKGVSLTAAYDASFGTFTSTSAYQDISPYLRTDSDNTEVPASSVQIYQPEKVYSQEFLFSSVFDGPAQVIAGVNYYKNEASRRQIASAGIPGPVLSDLDVNVHAKAWAVFGELHYEFSDRLRGLVGVRYSSEDKSIDGQRLSAPTLSILSPTVNWTSWTPRASLIYELTDHTNVYATFSRGFKSGNFNAAALSTVPVDPESIDAYEVGLKFARPGLRFNTSAYYYKYSDIQVQIQTNVGGVNSTVLQNAASAEVKGADADLTWTVNDNWRVSLGAAYTDGTYQDYPGALLTTPRFVTVAGYGSVPAGNTQVAGDASGNDLIRSPKVTANATLTYTHPVADAGELEGSVTVAYNDGFYWEPGERFGVDPYTLVNGRIAWTPREGNYRLSVWGNNLTDETYLIYGTATTSGDSGAYNRPRSFGVTLDVSFN